MWRELLSVQQTQLFKFLSGLCNYIFTYLHCIHFGKGWPVWTGGALQHQQCKHGHVSITLRCITKKEFQMAITAIRIHYFGPVDSSQMYVLKLLILILIASWRPRSSYGLITVLA